MGSPATLCYAFYNLILSVPIFASIFSLFCYRFLFSYLNPIPSLPPWSLPLLLFHHIIDYVFSFLCLQCIYWIFDISMSPWSRLSHFINKTKWHQTIFSLSTKELFIHFIPISSSPFTSQHPTLISVSLVQASRFHQSHNDLPVTKPSRQISVPILGRLSVTFYSLGCFFLPFFLFFSLPSSFLPFFLLFQIVFFISAFFFGHTTKHVGF